MPAIAHQNKILGANGVGGSWSEPVSCLAGVSSATFTEIDFENTAVYDVYTDDGTGEPIPVLSITADTNGKVKVTFKDALSNATDVKLHYWRVTGESSDEKWTAPIACSAGDTIAVFSSVEYDSDNIYDVYTNDGTGKLLIIASVTADSNGKVKVTFADELENNTNVRLHYWIGE